jgi:hypothetical protein
VLVTWAPSSALLIGALAETLHVAGLFPKFLNRTHTPIHYWIVLTHLSQIGALAHSILECLQVPGVDRLRRKPPPKGLRPWEFTSSARKSPAKGGLIRSFSSRALYRRDGMWGGGGLDSIACSPQPNPTKGAVTPYF